MKQSILICDMCFEGGLEEGEAIPVAVERVQLRTMQAGTKTLDMCETCFVDFIANPLLDVEKPTAPKAVAGRNGHTNPLTDRLYAAMKENDGELWDGYKVANTFNIEPQKGRATLLNLHKAGKIIRVARGQYVVSSS